MPLTQSQTAAYSVDHSFVLAGILLWLASQLAGMLAAWVELVLVVALHEFDHCQDISWVGANWVRLGWGKCWWPSSWLAVLSLCLGLLLLCLVNGTMKALCGRRDTPFAAQACW
jgi:hypothetical protein